MRGKATQAVSWLTRWGFAVLVGAGTVVAVWAAATIGPPAEIPSFALQAEPVYRLEIGAAVFAGIYFASMALVLALNNRAFSEIGMSGVKAHDLVDDEEKRVVREGKEAITALRAMVEKLDELADSSR